jgi:hypothetical protein
MSPEMSQPLPLSQQTESLLNGIAILHPDSTHMTEQQMLDTHVLRDVFTPVAINILDSTGSSLQTLQTPEALIAAFVQAQPTLTEPLRAALEPYIHTSEQPRDWSAETLRLILDPNHPLQQLSKVANGSLSPAAREQLTRVHLNQG